LVYDYDRHSFIDINQSAELLFRCPRDKLAVLGPWHFYSQEEGNAAQIAASVESHNRRALDGEKFTFDRRLRNADGQELICEVRVSRLPGADGCRLLRFSYIDVTERRKVMERLTFANTLLRSEIESSPDGVVVIDASTGLASWNAKFARMWQLSPATLASASPDDVLTDLSHALDQPEAFKADIHAFRRDPAAMVDRELSLLDGRSIECHTGVLSTPGGGVLGRIGFFRDVTARKRAEEALRQSEERFRAVSETAQDAIVTIDGKGKVVYWNGAAERSLGYTRAEAIGMDVHGLMASPVERERAAAGLHAFAQTGTGPILARVRELVARRKDGSEFPIELSVSAVELDSAWHAVAFMRDISERKLSETYIQHLARHDALTGLFNRRVFVDALNHEIGRADRDGTPFAVLYLDLDHFKDINDTLGHPVGDLVLKEVAARLLAVARETDTVARFGGDEFAVLQAGLEDPADAAVFAERMLASIAAPFFIDGNEIRSGTSVGIAMFDVGAEPERLLAQADVALYRAKAEGRGTFRYFTEAMDQEVHTRVRMGAELREAMASGQLFLVYQPQVEVDSGRIVGMEALVRWRHPERGLISPAEFIPIAEKTGLIIAVGQWVLREACRQARAWLDAGVPETLVAVNLSGLQFKSPHELESQVYELLAAHGLAPANLELELTESMLMDASQEHNDVLLRLRARGLRLAIDDFGTGYSSLNYLRRFPVDRIKIAQNFIAELTSNNGDAAIVKAALSLARELHLPAIVEGVETCEQLALLKEWGCREVQGYYYARPLPPDEAAALLRVGLLVPAASE
ncbi:MAG: EAL domain-containing protein, partial [Pseudomonadota bacterium]|nr:EAL domain-containing protein [Pseudomonadota bacterium]